MIEEEAKMSMKEEEDFEGKQRMEQNKPQVSVVQPS